MNEVNTDYMNPGETAYPYPYYPVPPMPIPPAAIIPVQVVQGPVGLQGPAGPQGIQGPKGEDGISNASPFKIIIDPLNKSGRIYGAVLDTIGGTYEIRLTNCRFLTEDEQLNAIYEDPLDGIPIPNCALSIPSLTELVGGNSLNEITEYDFVPILLENVLQGRLAVPTVELKTNTPIKVQSGSVIAYCIEPFELDSPCEIYFHKIEDNGRIFNFKRYIPSEEVIDLSTVEQPLSIEED